MRLTLGCPTLRRYDLLAGMIRSAVAGSRTPDRYYIIDNGGGLMANGTPDFVQPEMVIGVPSENLGCAGSWNKMGHVMLLTDDDALLIAADDILFECDTIGEMLHAMETEDVDFVTAKPGGFSCFMVRKRLFDKVGYFDEQFWPAYFEDNDFHRRMQLSGICKEAEVDAQYEHVNKGSQTVASFNRAEKHEHNQRFEKNRDRYVAKWGGLPHEEKFDEPYNGLAE